MPGRLTPEWSRPAAPGGIVVRVDSALCRPSAGGLLGGRRLVGAAPIGGFFLELGKLFRHLVELAFPVRVGLLALGNLEEHLHQRRHADRFDDGLLDAPGKDHGNDQRQRAGRAGKQRDQPGDGGENQQEYQEGQAPDDERQPERVFEKRLVVLGVQHQRGPTGRPRVVGLDLDVVGQDDLVEVGQGQIDDRIDEFGYALDARDGQEVGDREERPVEGFENALDQLVDAEQHRRFGETLAHDALRVVDLPLAAGQFSALHQFDQYRYVPGLDEIEQILADEVHDDPGDTESGHAAPQAARLGFAANAADAVADAGPDTGNQDVGQRDAEVDQKPEYQERQGLCHERDDLADLEIHHDGFAP